MKKLLFTLASFLTTNSGSEHEDGLGSLIEKKIDKAAKSASLGFGVYQNRWMVSSVHARFEWTICNYVCEVSYI